MKLQLGQTHLRADVDDKTRAEQLRIAEGSSTVSNEKRLLRALFYGDFGSGKSTTALKCVEDKGIWVTTDSAWVVIDKYPELQDKITRFPFTGFSQIRSFCEAKAEGIEPWASADTLIWDTFTGSIESTLNFFIDTLPVFNDQRHPEVPSWTHYGLIQRKLRETIDVLSKSQYNVIYLGHNRDPNEQDKLSGKFASRPNAPEASYNIVAREVQLLGWLFKEAKGSQKKIQFEGTTRQSAKSQVSTINETTYLLEQVPELIKKWKMR